MRIVFIRHAEPDYENDTVTPKGRREAEILAGRVSKWDVKDFYCSPYGRAVATATPTLEKCGREAIVYDWLKEFYYRVYLPENGQEHIAWDFMPSYFCPNDDLHDKDKWTQTQLMRSGDIEGYAREVYTGFDALLAEHGYVRRADGVYEVREHNDDTLVFFCHLGVSMLIMGHLTGIAAPSLWQGFFMAPTSVNVLCSEERQEGEASFRIQTLGDVRHLIEAGEPVSSSGYFTNFFEG